MFDALANNTRAEDLESEFNCIGAESNLILDELKPVQEHVVFKWISIDPNVKCLDITVSVNVKKVTLHLVASVHDCLPQHSANIWIAHVICYG